MFEVELANGYTIFISNDNDTGVIVGLVNPNGFVTSDKALDDKEEKLLRGILN